MIGSNIIRSSDVEILYTVSIFKFIPLKVLADILIAKDIYSFYQGVARSITRLEKQGLLRTKSYANNVKIIFLSKTGASVLSVNKGIPLENINCPDRITNVNFFAIEHTIEVSKLFYMFSTECEKYGFKLIEFQGDAYQRYEYSYKEWINNDQKKITKYVVPDAFVRIDVREEKVYEFFVEYDKGSEYSKDIAEKYQKYFEYYVRSEKYKDANKDIFPSILFITTTKKRILNLISAIPKRDDGKFRLYENRDIKNVVFQGISNAKGDTTFDTYKIDKFLKDENRFLFIEYESLLNNKFEANWLNFTQNPISLHYFLTNSFIEPKSN
jgi:hypothetical protein